VNCVFTEYLAQLFHNKVLVIWRSRNKLDKEPKKKTNYHLTDVIIIISIIIKNPKKVQQPRN